MNKIGKNVSIGRVAEDPMHMIVLIKNVLHEMQRVELTEEGLLLKRGLKKS